MTTKWADLTTIQRSALVCATGQGIAPKDLPLTITVPKVTSDGSRTITITETTVRALVDMQLLHLTANRKGRALYRPTDTGRGLVASRGLLPTFLHRRSQYGYTHSYHQAMTGEPEVIQDAA
jgi:hypothetical protein